jgi:uncharacterized membrane protein YdjX (TVP38/TMEM64 family)
LISMSKTSLSKIVPAAVTGLLVLLFLSLYFFSDSFQAFADDGWRVLISGEQERVEKWISGLSYWGPIVVLVCFIIQMFAFVIPSWLLIVVSVLAYGPLWGGLLALSGIVLAASLAYVIGASLSAYTLKRLLGEKAEDKMEKSLDRYGFWLIAIFRLAPFLSNDTISFVAGLTAMRFTTFICATVLGIAPLIGFVAYLGESSERLKTGLIWASVVSIIGFGIYVWWDRRNGKSVS